MTLGRVERNGLLGDQHPRVLWVPPCVSSAGLEVIEAAEMAGLVLDEWQKFVMAHSLGEREDGKWAAKEVGVVVPRQNGKGGLIEGREIGGLFVLGEEMIIHSAHQYDTSMEAFRRLLILIEETPEFDRRVARVVRSHGEEGIELKSGQRIRFRTRTKGGGRGFSCDCLILDEAMILPQAMHGALLPTLSARDEKTVSGTQTWYTGSAVDEDVHEHGLVFAKIRERGIAGGDDRLAFFEWSTDPERFPDPADPAGWAQANPGLGIRIPVDHVEMERRSLDPRTFDTERRGIGRWPRTDMTDGRVISAEAWRACGDPGAAWSGPAIYAVEVTPDRDRAAIGRAGVRPDGRVHVGVADSGDGTGWVVQACAAIAKQDRRARFIVDSRSPAGTLIDDLKTARLRVVELTTQQYVQACGDFFDSVRDARLVFRAPEPEIDAALSAAEVRSLGGAWAWERRSLMDMSPLVAVTVALWGALNLAPVVPRVVNLAALRRPGEA